MNKQSTQLTYMFIRYILIIILGLGNLGLVYGLVTLPTVYLSGLLLSLFYSVKIVGNVITIGLFSFELIRACVAGSAYYLLLILALSTKMRSWAGYIKLILLSWLILFCFNIFRIMIMVAISISAANYFDIVHMAFWYILSTVFVLFAWFVSAHYLKVQGVPVYSDFMYIYNNRK